MTVGRQKVGLNEALGKTGSAVLTGCIVPDGRAGSQVVMWASSADKATWDELYDASPTTALHNEWAHDFILSARAG